MIEQSRALTDAVAFAATLAAGTADAGDEAMALARHWDHVMAARW